MVVLEPLADGRSAQDQVIASRQCLKYLSLDITVLVNVHLTKDTKDLF